MESPHKTIEVVAALIFDAEGRVLATQCPPHKHGGGWEFPGGKMEPGESPAAAIEREIAEELGVHIKAGQVLHIVEWDYPTFHLRMHCLICTWESGELQLREHTAARWLSVDTLRSLDWLPADVDVLAPLGEYMQHLA